LKTIITLFLIPFFLYSATISGFLKDAADGEGMVEGNISLNKTIYGTASNDEGYYVLTSIPKGNYTITAQYMGFKPFEKKIAVYDLNQSIKLNINLEEDSFELDETEIIVDDEPQTQKEIVRDIRVSTLKVDTRKIKQVATFIQPDLFRVMKSLPGVVSTSDYSTGLFVRGGQDDHNLILNVFFCLQIKTHHLKKDLKKQLQ